MVTSEYLEHASSEQLLHDLEETAREMHTTPDACKRGHMQMDNAAIFRYLSEKSPDLKEQAQQIQNKVANQYRKTSEVPSI